MSTRSDSTRSGGERRPSRKRLSLHIAVAGLLAAIAAMVITFAGGGGGVASSSGSAGHSAQPVYFPSSCSTQPTSRTTLANAGYTYSPHTVTKTITKTLTHTRTLYRTVTKTVCRTVTSTAQGETFTTTVTGPGSATTVTEQGSTVTYTTTAPGSTTTETVTETLSGSTSGSTSTSTFNCPPEDTAGFALGESDYTVDPIFCSYPAFPGENANDFYCTYSASTGTLVTDNDAGFCPAQAPPKT